MNCTQNADIVILAFSSVSLYYMFSKILAVTTFYFNDFLEEESEQDLEEIIKGLDL